MIKRVLVGIIYIAIYLNLIFALYILFLAVKPIGDPSAQAISSIISILKFFSIFSTILWVVTVVVSVKKKEWLRKVLLLVAFALILLSHAQEYATIKIVSGMSMTEYSLMDYFSRLENYYSILWLVVIWIYLYKLGPVKEYFNEIEYV